MFSLLNNIGAAYIDLEHYDKAFQYLTEAYEIALETQNQIDISISLNNLGEVSLKMGLYSRSEDYLENALEIIKSERGDLENFDVVISGETTCTDLTKDREKVESWIQTGATWFLEDINGMRAGIDELRERIRAGPPTV